MSTITGPFTIAAGGSVVMPQPQAGGQLSQLILDNLSTYILVVNIGASVYFQAPLVEQSYDIIDTTQPVMVSSIVQPGDNTTSGQLAPTWHAIGEEQRGSWPIALSGPAEVAAATAAALLESGIPNVLTETVLITRAPPGQVLDVSGYASVIIEPSVQVIWQFQTYDGSPVGSQDSCNNPTVVPVIAPILVLVSVVGASGATVIGSNRTPAQGRATGLGYSSEGFLATTGNIAMVSGTNYQVPIVDGAMFQGPARVAFGISNISAAAGLFSIFTFAGTQLVVEDTSQMHAGPGSASGTGYVYASMAIPANANQFWYQCRASGTFNVDIWAIPAY